MASLKVDSHHGQAETRIELPVFLLHLIELSATSRAKLRIGELHPPPAPQHWVISFERSISTKSTFSTDSISLSRNIVDPAISAEAAGIMVG